MYDDWKELIAEEMQRDLDAVMDEIESDPAMKDIEAPKDMYDNVLAMIDEHEKQKIYEQLSDEDKELIQLGKVYKKQRKFNKFVVALAAVIVGLGISSVCIGENKNIFKIISSMFAGQERTAVSSEDTELVTYIKEEDVYEKVKEEYEITPVKLEYLPQDVGFKEAVFCPEIQAIYMYYGVENKTDITYIIRPNYRESSFVTVIEDDKLQEYTLIVSDIEISLTEYNIEESNQNRWSILWTYQDVQYVLNITDIEQVEVEKVVNTLRFVK